MPVPLEEAAQRFDSAYRLLLNAPPDDISTPDGVARVTERHSCAYSARRFGHVIMEYRGRVVSLLMTANDGETGDVGQGAIPHVVGRPMNGLSVVSVNGRRHAILLVSDLNPAELTQLSRAVSMPLARRLEVGATPPASTIAALLAPVQVPSSIWNQRDRQLNEIAVSDSRALRGLTQLAQDIRRSDTIPTHVLVRLQTAEWKR